MRKTDVDKMVGIAVFSAVVVVLQLLGSFIKFGPFSISLVLVPIVVGAALYGKAAGAWLGLVFGATVLLSGDAALFLAISIPGTFLTVLIKGILAGLITCLVYKAFESKNRWLATILAAFVCPIVNTGVFLIGCYVFFYEGIHTIAQNMGFEGSVDLFIFTVLIGGNFIFEMIVNLVLSPIVIRIIDIGKRIYRHRK